MARLSYIVTIVSIALMCILAEELYPDQYDDIDAANILENDKLRNQYYNCFMETSPCLTADAKFFKGILIECLNKEVSDNFNQLEIKYSSQQSIIVYMYQ